MRAYIFHICLFFINFRLRIEKIPLNFSSLNTVITSTNETSKSSIVRRNNNFLPTVMKNIHTRVIASSWKNNSTLLMHNGLKYRDESTDFYHTGAFFTDEYIDSQIFTTCFPLRCLFKTFTNSPYPYLMQKNRSCTTVGHTFFLVTKFSSHLFYLCQ